MSLPIPRTNHRPRELRRRVVSRARVRDAARWYDACILNISSRGLLIQSFGRAIPGSIIQIQHRDRLIIATVMWAHAGHCGLRTADRLPVEDILSVAHTRSLHLIASDGVIHDRRDRSRTQADLERIRGRMLEFVGVGGITLILAGAVLTMASVALSGPLGAVSTVLGR